MTNSTYLATVNRILEHAGQTPFADATAFNSGTPEKIQLQAKRFVDRVNRMLLRKTRPRFSRREFTISATSASNAYSLDATTAPEYLIEHSWYIATTGYGARLEHKDYDYWKDEYPESETTQGIPTHWIMLPFNGTADRVAFSPPASTNLSIKYSGYLIPVVLSAATDVIVWPVELEDIIWDYGWQYVETVLAEGKAQDVQALMSNLYEEIAQFTRGPSEATPTLKMGFGYRAGP